MMMVHRFESLLLNIPSGPEPDTQLQVFDTERGFVMLRTRVKRSRSEDGNDDGEREKKRAAQALEERMARAAPQPAANGSGAVPINAPDMIGESVKGNGDAAAGAVNGHLDEEEVEKQQRAVVSESADDWFDGIMKLASA